MSAPRYSIGIDLGTTHSALAWVDIAGSDGEATVHGTPYMLSVKPWPKIATGQPPAGLVPEGVKSVRPIVFVESGAGVPVAVP